MPGVRFIPSQGIKKTNLISSDIRHNHFIPTQGYTSGVGQVLVQDVMAYDSTGVDWFNEAWNERVPLTIQPAQIPSTQTNYTLLINSIISDLIGATAIELRFAKSDKIQLKYQIEKFDTLTGELIAKVLLPTADVGDLVYVYSDNPLAVDEQSTGAWDVNYKFVYPLHGNGIDSTSNGQDLTIFGTTTVSAKIGDGISFSGIQADHLIRNPITGFPSTKITAEFWAKTTGTADGLISYATALTDANDFLLLDQSNIAVFINDTPRNVSLNINDGNFHHVVITWDSVIGALVVYLDKIMIHSTTGFRTGMTIVDGGSLVLGQDQDNVGNEFSDNQAYDGILNEVRISNIIRDADYVTTAFNNQDNPDAFYSIGAMEIFSPIDVFGYDPVEAVEIPLTIIAGQVPSPQTNFEFLIDSTFPAFIGKSKSKFRFVKNLLDLPYTIIEYNPATGKLRAWVLLSSASVGDEIRITNDDSEPAPSLDDPTAVWSEYERVWYMDKVLGGVVDSTGKSANGEETGGVTPTPGLFGDALDFAGDTKFITFPTLSILNKISVYMWINFPLPNQQTSIIFKNPVNSQWGITTIGGEMKWRITNGLKDIVVAEPSTNEWHLLVCTQNGTAAKFYIDGVSINDGTQDAFTDNTGSITIGIHEAINANFSYKGLVGLSTIQNEILTQDRITALFNNQINPETFYSIGVAEIDQFPITDVMGYDVIVA